MRKKKNREKEKEELMNKKKNKGEAYQKKYKSLKKNMMRKDNV